jgi:hypothetical protein
MKEGMVFEGDNTPDNLEDFLNSWEMLNYRRVEENLMIEAEIAREKGREKAAGKKKVDASKKRKDAPPAPPAPAAAAEAIPTTSEGSSKKRKTKEKASPSKALVFSLDEALARGNRLSTKTKDNEVEAIYKALDAGLSHVFPYKKHRLPGVIPLDRLHIAPDELKYCRIAKERFTQVSVLFILLTPVRSSCGIGCQPICLISLAVGMNLTILAIVIRLSKYTRDMDRFGRNQKSMEFP